MMARTLTPTVCLAVIVSIATGRDAPADRAQDTLQRAGTSHRTREAEFKNPFSTANTAPPLESAALSGPRSRWQRTLQLTTEPTALRSAILSLNPVEEAIRASQPAVPEPARRLPAATPPDPTDFQAQPIYEHDFVERVVQPDRFTPAPKVMPLQAHDEPAAGDALLTHAISDYVASPEQLLADAERAAQRAATIDDLASVIELGERGLATNPKEKLAGALRRLTAWAHNRRGELLAEAKRQQDAFEDFSKAVALDPQSSLALHNRAVSLAEQKQFTEALTDFDRVIELNPGLALAYRNRAELLVAIGRADDAVEDYTRALEIAANDFELYRARAYAHQQHGDLGSATRDLDRAIQLEPGNAGLYVERGNLAAEQGRFERALSEFAAALDRDPECAEAYRSRAWLLATCPDEQHQDAAAALADAERAAELAPEDHFVLDTLAVAHAATGDYHSAVDVLQQALEDVPSELSARLRARLAGYHRQLPSTSDGAPDAVRRASLETTPVDAPAEQD